MYSIAIKSTEAQSVGYDRITFTWNAGL